MMDRRKLYITLFLISSFGLYLFGNDDGLSDSNLSANSCRNQILHAQISTGDPDKKLEALELIETLIAKKRVDNSDCDFMGILHTLATEPYLNPQKEGIGRKLVNDHPMIRRKAVTLLGDIKGTYAIDTLCTVLSHEEQIDVLISTMYSLTRIGENPSKKVTDSVHSLIYRLRSKQRISNELAYSTLLALESMYDHGQDLDDPKVYWVLVTLNDDQYVDVVKNAYARVLDKLWES